MSDTFSRLKRRQIMQSVRRKGTAPEKFVIEELRVLKLCFRKNVKSFPGSPDFVIDSPRIVIFVHGCFWHGHKTCRKGRSRPKTNRRFWVEKVERNRRRDRRVAAALRRRGYRVFTVWECELNKGRLPTRLERLLQPFTNRPQNQGPS